jgi:hypothetical protein
VDFVGHIATRSRGAVQLLLTFPLVLLLVFSVACGGDDDDDAETDAGTSTTASSSPTAASGTSATTTSAVGLTGSATATEAEATETESDAAGTEVEATATETEASATETETDDETPTAEADDTETAGGEDPLEDLQTLDPEALPNFSMTWSIEFVNMPDSTLDTSIAAQLEQSSVDNYHIRFDSDGEIVETWLVDGTAYSDFGDGITSAPAGQGFEVFTPSTMLTTVPEVEDTPGVEKVGTDTIEGRETTRYHMSGEDFLTQSMEDAGGESGFEGATNIGGGIDFWIDNELKIMIKAEGEVTWTNPDGTDGHMTYNVAISDIGSTPEVTAPQ